jgi:hypothetical protein
MNTHTKLTPSLESLRKAIREYQPNPRRVPFSRLMAFHDAIVELRGKRASYSVIAELLQQHGVRTSRARVAEYGRIVLDGGKSRKRWKRAKTAPAAHLPAAPQTAPAVATKPAPATITPANHVPPPATEHSAFVSCGPHIAHVEQLSPEEAAEFEASLKSGNAPKP